MFAGVRNKDSLPIVLQSDVDLKLLSVVEYKFGQGSRFTFRKWLVTGKGSLTHVGHPTAWIITLSPVVGEVSVQVHSSALRVYKGAVQGADGSRFLPKPVLKKTSIRHNASHFQPIIEPVAPFSCCFWKTRLSSLIYARNKNSFCGTVKRIAPDKRHFAAIHYCEIASDSRQLLASDTYVPKSLYAHYYI